MQRVFFTFAGWGGWKGSLSINELKELATQQLTHLLKVVSSLDEKMKGLDGNQGLGAEFSEHWRQTAELAEEMRKKTGLEIWKK